MNRTLLFSFFVVLFSTGIHAQTIKTKTASGVDLTLYERFTFVKGEVMVPDEEKKIDEQKLFEELKVGVVRELEARGYKYVEDSTEQMIVSYVAGAYNKTVSENLGPMGGMPAQTGADIDQSRSWGRNSQQGFLIMDILDKNSKKEIWSAESQMDLATVDPLRALDAIAFKSFKKFPSRLKKKKK
jgi:Domain of unknown function (DUF4136)